MKNNCGKISKAPDGNSRGSKLPNSTQPAKLRRCILTGISGNSPSGFRRPSRPRLLNEAAPRQLSAGVAHPEMLEAREGFEPSHRSFADCRVNLFATAPPGLHQDLSQSSDAFRSPNEPTKNDRLGKPASWRRFGAELRLDIRPPHTRRHRHATTTSAAAAGESHHLASVQHRSFNSKDIAALSTPRRGRICAGRVVSGASTWLAGLGS